MSAPIVTPLAYGHALEMAIAALRPHVVPVSAVGYVANCLINVDVASRTQAVADLRAQIPQLCISCDDSRAMHEETGDESPGRCLVVGCPCTCSPDQPEYFIDVPAKEEVRS